MCRIRWKIVRMARGDQTHKSAGGDGIIGSSSGKSSNRKSKQRRAPQRGLGVAQLEKIRLEEQLKNNAPAIFSSPSLSPAKTSSKPSVSVPNSHPMKQSSSSIPLTSLSSAHFSPSNFMFRSPLPSHGVDDTNMSNNTPRFRLNNGGFETEWSDMSLLGQRELVPNSRNPLEFNLQKDNSAFDSYLAFRSNFGLTNELSNLGWPYTGLVQKEHRLSSSAGMDASTSSSLLNFPTEPPSNQSSYGNYTTVWPEMYAMKRPYSLSLDNPAGPSLSSRPPMAAPMRSSDESASCSNVGLYSYPFFGEGPSCSSSSSEPNSRKRMKGNAFKGDLLTLATPTTTGVCQGSKLKNFSAHAVDSNHKFQDLVLLPLRGGMEMTSRSCPESSWTDQLQPYYRFFPPAVAQSGQISSCCFNAEDESVDLNLKL